MIEYFRYRFYDAIETMFVPYEVRCQHFHGSASLLSDGKDALIKVFAATVW